MEQINSSIKNTENTENTDNENKEDFIEVSTAEMKQIINSGAIENKNSRNAGLNNLTKLLYDDSIKWYLYKNGDKIVACAACRENKNPDSLYINQICSFEKGFGAKLLTNILNLNNYAIIYLNSDWSQGDSLNSYYRKPEFGLTEYIKDDSKIHYFYKNKTLEDKELQKFITNSFIL